MAAVDALADRIVQLERGVAGPGRAAMPLRRTVVAGIVSAIDTGAGRAAAIRSRVSR